MWEKFIHSKFYGEMYKDKSGYITKEVDDKHISVIFLTNDGLKTFTKFRNSQIYLKPQRQIMSSIILDFPNKTTTISLDRNDPFPTGYGDADFDVARSLLTYLDTEYETHYSNKHVLYRTDNGAELGYMAETTQLILGSLTIGL